MRCTHVLRDVENDCDDMGERPDNNTKLCQQLRANEGHSRWCAKVVPAALGADSPVHVAFEQPTPPILSDAVTALEDQWPADPLLKHWLEMRFDQCQELRRLILCVREQRQCFGTRKPAFLCGAAALGQERHRIGTR